jgi:hypothetical protein
MNNVDCLRLKPNYAWWLFSGVNITHDKFKESVRSPILHHFNDHLKRGTWCKCTTKGELKLKKTEEIPM